MLVPASGFIDLIIDYGVLTSMPVGGRNFQIRFGGLLFLIVVSYYIFFRKDEAQTEKQRSNFDRFANYDDLVVEWDVAAIEKDISDNVSDEFLSKMNKRTRTCPNYVDYSQSPHGPYSSGKFHYPYMRPAPKCRTFVSPTVEKVINDLKLRIRDPDLARLVENCLPNTLDTTILWHQSSETDPQSFVVTGDIHAEWLRDAARQLSVYQPLVKHDEKLKNLMLGAINTQARYINISPYCNAFHPPPRSHVKRGDTAKDDVFPRPNWHYVFECKYELDSLASFLTLTNDYYENSDGDLLFLSDLWMRAFEKILIVMKRESVPTFDKETGQPLGYYYAFKRQTNIGTETLPLNGVGNPVNFGTGLVRSAFRPSDDATILQFFIPANAHMVTELKRLRANFLNSKIPPKFEPEGFIATTDRFIEQMEEGIKNYGVVQHPNWGSVYAYEVDGYGGNVFMDDANIPSLLSLPDMGFLDATDDVYQNTRKMVLANEGNPYYLEGEYFKGIGGPHIGIQNAWPMSQLVKIRTSDNDHEILDSLHQIMTTTANLGLMHESVHVNSPHGRDFTRSWFAWCNSEFGKTILHLALHKPHLIFKYGEAAYRIDDALS